MNSLEIDPIQLAMYELSDEVLKGTNMLTLCILDRDRDYEMRIKMRDHEWYASVVVSGRVARSEAAMSVLRQQLETVVAEHRGMVPKRFRLETRRHEGQYMVNCQAVRALNVGMIVKLGGKDATVTSVRYSGPGFITVMETRWERAWSRVKAWFGAKVVLEFHGLVPESTP